jgi:hypothetical protein
MDPHAQPRADRSKPLSDQQPGVRITLDDIWDVLQDLRDRMATVEQTTVQTADLSRSVVDHEHRITVVEQKVDGGLHAHESVPRWISVAVSLGSLAVAALSVAIILMQAI